MSIAFVTGKSLPRRTFLRGMGAAVGLPFLDAMVPAGRPWRTMAADVGRTRLICMEEVHGLAGCTPWGETQYLFAPEHIGPGFELTPANVLSKLEPFQEYMTIVSNTDCRMAESYAPPEIGGDHFRSSATFLTQSHPKQTMGSDVYAGVSLDQIYAQRFGQDTAIPSMQLQIDNLDQSGGCYYNYSCAYTDAISWATPTNPLPMIQDPRVAFEMLFGTGATAEERVARRRTNRSILDWVAQEAALLKRELGSGDRSRLDQYLSNVRELERRIERVEAQNTSGEPRLMPEAPAGVPDTFTEHMEMMYDIQVLGLESDITRVFSFKWARDASNRVIPESGSNKAFHPASHHGGNREAIIEWNLIHQYRLGTMNYLLEKMKNSVEADGNLLDKTMIVWGSPMADGNLHSHRHCPLVLFGKANGQLQGNVHLKAPEGTPMANAMLTCLHKLGLDDLESFGDSSGQFALEMSGPPATLEGA
jgi:hypothetical protein